MATCHKCGQWLGQAMVPTPGASAPRAGTPLLPTPLVCPRCRAIHWRTVIELVACALMVVAALVCLWGAWQRDSHWPDAEQKQLATEFTEGTENGNR